MADMINESDAPVITHYLVNFIGQGTPVTSQTIALELGKALAGAGVDLLAAQTYISQLGVDPYRIGLKENWDKVNGADREEFQLRFPELAMCLDLLTQRGVNNGTTPGNGGV
jgi:hypothetical protein